MKRVVVCAVAVAMTFGLAAASSAQGWMQVTDTKPNTIKVGVFWPSDKDVRRDTKSLWFVGAFERVINESPGSNTDLTAEVGYFKRSGLQIIPVTVNWRNHSGDSIYGGRSSYWGAGVGAYFIDPPNTWVGSNSTRVGVNAFYGIQSDAYLAELKYHYARAYGGNIGGIVASVGYRF